MHIDLGGKPLKKLALGGCARTDWHNQNAIIRVALPGPWRAEENLMKSCESTP